jgi:hypothetical protein
VCLVGDNRVTEKVTVDWVDSPSTTGKVAPPRCDALPPGQEEEVAIPPAPDPGPPVSTNLAGSFSEIVVPKNIVAGKDFQVRSKFTATKPGKYYLEAGTMSTAKTASIAIPKGSQCDGDIHWSGKYIDLDVGETIDAVYSMEAYSEVGNYDLIVGAYTGCLVDGGELVDKEIVRIQVVEGGQTVMPGTKGSILMPVLGIGGVIVGGVLTVLGVPYVGLPVAALGIITFFVG